MNSVDNTAFIVEFFGPGDSQGSITHFKINANCLALDYEASREIKIDKITSQDLQKEITSKGGRYEYQLNGLQAFSNCSLSLIAFTRIGPSGAVTCAARTPFTGVNTNLIELQNQKLFIH